MYNSLSLGYLYLKPPGILQKLTEFFIVQNEGVNSSILLKSLFPILKYSADTTWISNEILCPMIRVHSLTSELNSESTHESSLPSLIAKS